MSSGDFNWVPPSLSKFLAKIAENKLFLGNKLLLRQEGVISTFVQHLYWLSFFPVLRWINITQSWMYLLKKPQKHSKLPEWFEIAIYIHSTMICEKCLCVFFIKFFLVNELNEWERKLWDILEFFSASVNNSLFLKKPTTLKLVMISHIIWVRHYSSTIWLWVLNIS